MLYWSTFKVSVADLSKFSSSNTQGLALRWGKALEYGTQMLQV